MAPRLFIVIGLALLSTQALAGADLEPTISGPSSTDVYATGRYTVTVANVGNKNANGSSVVIQLPETNTSPTVHVMGDLGAYNAKCTQVGTTLDCDLGRIRKRKSKSVWFDIDLPESSDLLVIDATSDSASDGNSANDDDSYAPVLDNFAVVFTAPLAVLNEHCTGTDLTSFYECALYPSSITSHSTTLNANGTISFAGNPAGYAGTWSASTSGDYLEFQYTYNGDVVADFEGWGVDSTCWEGVTEFPQNTAYVSPYRVCW